MSGLRDARGRTGSSGTIARVLCLLAACACLPGSPVQSSDRSGGNAPGALDRGENGLWMRRHWLHESPARAEISALAESLRARGITRIYPFLGPMDGQGWPGWRSKAGFVRYDPAGAGAFLAEFHRIAPEIRVLPWTGGIRERDVNLQDEAQRSAFLEHVRRLVALGADGVHLNIEPVPSGASGYLEFLRAVKAAIGDRTLSVAAYPPPLPGDPDNEAHWQMPFMREVCRSADELAFMAYNTGSASATAFETLIAAWTRELAAALPQRKAGGCEWLMGVPAYDEEEEYHRPDVETVEHSLKGIAAGLRASGRPESFRGVAIYASFTADAGKWAVYDTLWRGVKPVKSPPPDPRNTRE